MTMFSTIFSVSILLNFATAQTWSIGQTVKTSSGSLTGKASEWKLNVSEYLGIPFAQPPVGDLRFAAPKAYKSDKAIRVTQYGNTCPTNLDTSRKAVAGTVKPGSFASSLLAVLGQSNDTFNEDCLTLNIWTKPQTGEAKKAVMVWIYGGGFNSGNSMSPMYNGARLADEQDVVVVSINYRTNIFGFPRAEFLPDQNLGLLDQRLAVEWIRDNIAGFGGDPDRIIIFGQSAGGASVDYYAYAWAKDPIVKGIIAESGTASIPAGSGATISAGWYKTSQALGCGGAESKEKTLACMRSKKWEDITANIDKRGVTPNLGSGGFGPVVDEKVVFSDYASRRDKGNFAKVPFLCGATNNEGGLYELIGRAQGQGDSAKTFGAMASSMLGCSPQAAVAARRKAGVPAWRYMYQGGYPNQDIGIPGAWHTSEIGLVFGTTELISNISDTVEERKLEDVMQKAWTGFAKDPINALTKLGWPLYNDNESTVIVLGGVNSSAVTFENKSNLHLTCPSI